MKKLTLSACVLSALTSVAQTNNSPVLMEIGNKKVTKAEFENIYHKNNKDKATDKKTITEYVELFTNFKLKVKAAEDMGLDTSATYKSELEGYRKNVSQPYLTDKEVNEKLLTEAYDRTKMNVSASHILITCDVAALPKDTLIAYNKVMALRARILKGESFGKVARENSQDPSAKDNSGELGYFSALQMVYPFENAAFNTKVGEVSMPVRTKFGYHIVKVNDKRNDPGTITAAHILVLSKKGASAEDSLKAFTKINEINDRIKKGDKFAELATQYSDDKGSARNGGELAPFGINRMVPEFENAAFALKNDGDVSAPFKTSYGWHIVKRISVKPVAAYADMKADLKQRIQKDMRSQKGKESFIAKVKAEYKFTENLKNRDELTKTIDTSFFNGTWKAAKKAANMNKVICTLAGKNYTQMDYATYLEKHQGKGIKGSEQQMVTNNYTPYIEALCTDYETTQLATKYPEYKALIEEYKDGILLFDLTDQKVWSAAIKDSVGLQKFYDANKQNYMWEERYETVTYKCKDAKICENVNKMLAKKKTNDEILKVINKDSQLNLSIDRVTYKKGENKSADAAASIKMPATISENNMFYTCVVDKILPVAPKALSEARGIITADYQNFLEKEWLKELRAKYVVKVNKEVLDTIQ
jgi:peptidyl-prolyl cis-trans isomerase SurA